MPIGTGLQLGAEIGSSPDLYRNDAGASYPYTLAESVEIVGSSTGSDFYYFFYNWEVHPYNCASDRVPVTAVVEFESDIEIDPVDYLCLEGDVAALTASEAGGTWSSDCGVCIDEMTGEFDPTAAGTGAWEIVYTVPHTCSYLNTITIDVLESDIFINVIDNLCSQGTAVTLTASEAGGTWSASCGACIDPVTGEFDPALAGIGEWTVTYDVDGTCSIYNASTVSVVDCLGLPSEDQFNVRLYPNPNNGLVNINMGEISEGDIIIKDVLGKTVFVYHFTTSLFTADLSAGYADGTYFIEFYGNAGQLIGVKKFVKQ